MILRYGSAKLFLKGAKLKLDGYYRPCYKLAIINL